MPGYIDLFRLDCGIFPFKDWGSSLTFLSSFETSFYGTDCLNCLLMIVCCSFITYLGSLHIPQASEFSIGFMNLQTLQRQSPVLFADTLVPIFFPNPGIETFCSLISSLFKDFLTCYCSCYALMTCVVALVL